MAYELPKKQPHEILGVSPDADLFEITLAYNRQAPKLNPAYRPAHDELAARRFQRLKDAYDTMAAAHGFKSSPDPVLVDYENDTFIYDPNGRHKPFAEAAEIIEKRKTQMSREQRVEDFKIRMRVGRLIHEWNDYMKFVGNRHTIVDEIKAETGDRFTRLKAAFRRTDEDRTLWAAEKYLRAGGADFMAGYDMRQLGGLIQGFRTAVMYQDMGRVNPGFLELAEDELKLRREHTEEALEIMRHERKYITFMVP